MLIFSLAVGGGVGGGALDHFSFRSVVRFGQHATHTGRTTSTRRRVSFVL